MHILHPQLTIYEVAVGIHKARLTQAYRLDLGACEHDACGVGIYKLVIKRSLLILYVDRCGFLLFHQPKRFDNVLNNIPIIVGEKMIAADVSAM